MLGFFTDSNLIEFQIGHLAYFSSFLSNRRLRVFLDGKSSQEYPVNAGVPQGSIIGAALLHYILLTVLMIVSVILVSILVILLSTLSDQTLELASELESDLQDTVDWGRS